MRLNHILVPTDFGDASRAAEDAAVHLAEKFDADITLLHAWSVPTPAYAEGLVWPLDEIEAAARKTLADTCARVTKKHTKTKMVLVAGVAWECIVEAAKQRGVDLIVMGTHGRRGVSRLFLGSIAEKVVRLSPVPVLTVGPE
jgi:nucleotide-binding universal stress UspA family protein